MMLGSVVTSWDENSVVLFLFDQLSQLVRFQNNTEA